MIGCLDPDGVNVIGCLEKFTSSMPLLEDLLCDQKPKTGCSDTNRSITNIAKPSSRLRCVSLWCASFICAHFLRWLRSYLSLDWLNAVDWFYCTPHGLPRHKFLSKMVLEQVDLTPCQLFYFFFAAFTGFFAFVFLTILNIKICIIAL